VCQGPLIASCGGLRDLGYGVGFKAEDRGEVGFGLLPVRTANIPGNSGTLVPVDTCPLFESGEELGFAARRSWNTGVMEWWNIELG
jgi:hypothetical protein